MISIYVKNIYPTYKKTSPPLHNKIGPSLVYPNLYPPKMKLIGIDGDIGVTVIFVIVEAFCP